MKNKGGATVGVDIGGTFTDLVAITDRGFVSTKTATMPEQLAEGVVNCLRLAELPLETVADFLHGSTIAINTVLERKGSVTALLTTKGFADVYEIGRSNRPQSFDLAFQRPRPLVPRTLRFEVDERIDAGGKLVRALEPTEVVRLGGQMIAAGVGSVAICFLHSYRNPVNEAEAARILRQRHPELFVTASNEILREIREYERTSTTVLNAYVGPKVAGYLGDLDRSLSGRGFGGSLQIMRSNGGTMSLAQARGQPVWMMESGPVAGMIGAAELARCLSFDSAIGFDMGGTTAKATLISGGVPLFREGYVIGPHATGQPMQLPVVDVIEIGAGGGSLARVDAHGALQIGPESAGASPGPACYQRGGTLPTVTDANLLLGRLNSDRFLGGGMKLDTGRAQRAVEEHVSRSLGVDATRGALGIVQIADTMMSLAVRAVSVERGVDPRQCTLIAFGGAGPLHAVAVAREIGIPRVAVPRHPGTFSALGMLLATWRQDFVHTFVSDLSAAVGGEIKDQFGVMERLGNEQLQRDGLNSFGLKYNRSVDLRYRGQDHALAVQLESTDVSFFDGSLLRRKFEALHERHYGHASYGDPVELINLRLTMTLDRDESLIGRVLNSPFISCSEATTDDCRDVYFADSFKPLRAKIVWRPALPVGFFVEGPAVVEEENATTLLHPGDRALVGPTGVLMIEVKFP